MVTTLPINDDDADEFREAVRNKYKPRHYGMIKKETERMVKNHIALLNSEAKQ